MPLQATSGAASYDAFGGGVPFEPTYIEQIFQTYLYTGNGSTQTITNGIDLAGKGGLVWIKSRNVAGTGQFFQDTVRGANQFLDSTTTGANQNISGANTVFTTTGFSQNNTFQSLNNTGDTYASWTFREQPKFFDVVTYTGDGTAGRTVAHNLGSVPGCILIKATDSAQNWFVYHRSLNNDYTLILNSTSAKINSAVFNFTDPTSTNFTLGTSSGVNGSGISYVAYLFAHNAGGFGLTGTDNVISCGSFTTDGSANATVNLGYEPQWLLLKRSSIASNWQIVDNMRGLTAYNSDPAGGRDPALEPNTSRAEQNDDVVSITSTGFTGPFASASQTYIYIAIRRGPMKVPTTGTSVYTANTYGSAGDSKAPAFRSSFPVDLFLFKNRASAVDWRAGSRLQGAVQMNTNTTAAESSNSLNTFDYQNGWYNDTGVNANVYSWMFRRAPGFFDEVCYTGTGTAGQTYTHNLAAVPELMIVKRRNSTTQWAVYAAPIGATKVLYLNSDGIGETSANFWLDTAPTSSVFTVGAGSGVNGSGNTYVNYLFASAPGVSKVGSFTGTGATQVINCGFTGGARFVLIKATSTTGNWLVWDSARGIVAGNDPYLALNSTAAEVTNTDWVDTAATGFELSNAGGNLANSNGVSYIFLAIA